MASTPTPEGWTELPAFDRLGVPVRMFSSDVSGLRVCLLNCEGPLVSGYTVLATEATTNEYAHRHDGLPHTLEHLVFLGSELYPFKGVLDKLANRCLAQGTNAWTDVDHTAYTITTAGSEGFLNLLPIYMDHVLFPTLTGEAFTTEIHHVTEEGDDKGVVYCEMQGRENTGESLVDRACLDQLYPDPLCGYNAETGGTMEQLRGCTNSAIQRYHKEYYRTDNCCLVVTGGVDAGALLAALSSTEAKVAATKAAEPDAEQLPRPWARAVEAGWEGGSTELEFPSEDESTGFVCLCWRGPQYAEFEEKLARKLLWSYLSDSAVSPLQKAFVECDGALAGDVGAVAETFSTGYEQLWFSDCDTATLAEIPAAFEKMLAEQAAAGVDMERMATVMSRYKRRYLSAMEDSPADQLLWPVVKHFLYTNKAPAEEMDELNTASDTLGTLATIQAGYDAAKWLALLNTALVAAPKSVVIGRPSAAKATSSSTREEARVKAQAEALGAEALKMKGEVLAAAVAKNETPPPEELLASLPIPDASKVSSVACTTAIEEAAADGAVVVEGPAADELRAHLEATKPADGGLSSAAGVQWTHVASVFVKVEAALDGSRLPTALRLCLPLLLESVFKLGVMGADGVLTPAEEVIEALQRDTVSFAGSVGRYGSTFTPGSFGANAVFFSVKAEATELSTAIGWLHKLLYRTVLDPAVLKVQAAKLLTEIPSMKREPGAMAGALITEEIFGADAPTNHAPLNMIRQADYLKTCVAALEAGGEAADAVVAELEACRTMLTDPCTTRWHVATDILKIPAPHAALAEVLPPPVTEAQLLAREADPTAPSFEQIRSSAYACKAEGYTPCRKVLGLSTAENSTLRQSAAGLGAHHPDLPALLVAIEYLTGLEGDFWCKIRGLGLSYGYGISNSCESERLSFNLSRSTDPVEAHKAAAAIIAGYGEGGTETITDTALESTKSSVVFEIIEGADTKSAAVGQAWSHLFSGKTASYEKDIMSAVLGVTTEQALTALRTHLVPLFDTASSTLIVVVPTNKVESVSAAFDAEVVKEDDLGASFPSLCVAGAGTPPAAAEQAAPAAAAAKVAAAKGGLVFGWANKGCDCPRCDKPAPAV